MRPNHPAISADNPVHLHVCVATHQGQVVALTTVLDAQDPAQALRCAKRGYGAEGTANGRWLAESPDVTWIAYTTSAYTRPDPALDLPDPETYPDEAEMAEWGNDTDLEA